MQAKDAGREDLPSVAVQDTMSKRSARSLSAGTEQVRPTTALVALGEIDEVDDFVLLPGGGNSRAFGETSASLRSKFAAAEQRGGSIGGSGDEDVLGPAGSLRSVNMSASRSASIRSSFLGSHFRRESIRALTDAQVVSVNARDGRELRAELEENTEAGTLETFHLLLRSTKEASHFNDELAATFFDKMQEGGELTVHVRGRAERPVASDEIKAVNFSLLMAGFELEEEKAVGEDGEAGGWTQTWTKDEEKDNEEKEEEDEDRKSVV